MILQEDWSGTINEEDHNEIFKTIYHMGGMPVPAFIHGGLLRRRRERDDGGGRERRAARDRDGTGARTVIRYGWNGGGSRERGFIGAYPGGEGALWPVKIRGFGRI